MLFHVPFLRVRHDLDGRIVLDQGKPAVDRRGRFADRSPNIFQRGLMLFLHRVPDALVRLDQRDLFRAVEDRFHGSGGVFHRPLAVFLLQGYVDNPQVISPISGLHGGHAVNGALGQVNAGLTLKGSIREHLVRMPE
ncbi:hypothetical protein D1872_293080 [compost metagenome]